MHRTIISSIFIISLFAKSLAATNNAQSSDIMPIVSALSNLDCYHTNARFCVAMPQLHDDVEYNLIITQQQAPTDSLLPCSYLIDWTLTSREEPVNGFTAYFNGNYYSFSGKRLQEYHTEWDSSPFKPKQTSSKKPGGIQRTAQFANLLPATISEQLMMMLADSCYKLQCTTDSLVDTTPLDIIEVQLKLNGETAMEATYCFDSASKIPISIHYENNPGSVSEQSVKVTYTNTSTEQNCDSINEAMLVARHRVAFEKFRESNFRITNLQGTHLPGFALPSISGERVTRLNTEPFAMPTIVALLDANHSFTPLTISSLRNAAASLPFETSLIIAFVNKHIGQIEQLIPKILSGETILMSATPLARDCGATSFPTMIICDKQGIVKKIIEGYNKSLTFDVIQLMALLSPLNKTGLQPSLKPNHTNNITPMETIHFKGTQCHTYGTLPAVGSMAPEFNLTSRELTPVRISDFNENTIVLNIFPSLDTDVCARSVRRFNEEAAALKRTKVICVSQDLPFAMNRFCTTEGIENVIAASAFRSPNFGESYGVTIVDGPLAGLLARAVIIIAPDGTVLYSSLNDEITNEPDYDAALRILSE